MRDSTRNDTTRIFGFAVGERDWPLAGLIAAVAGHDLNLLAGMRWELEQRTPADESRVTLCSLRALGQLLRTIAHLGRGRG